MDLIALSTREILCYNNVKSKLRRCAEDKEEESGLLTEESEEEMIGRSNQRRKQVFSMASMTALTSFSHIFSCVLINISTYLYKPMRWLISMHNTSTVHCCRRIQICKGKWVRSQGGAGGALLLALDLALVCFFSGALHLLPVT